MGDRETYRGWKEGDKDPAGGDDAGVRAGEARKGSARGVERRLTGTGRSERARKAGGLTGGEMLEEAAGGASNSVAGLDYRLRRRLAEVLSSAGVDAGRVAVEILYLLPQEFVRGYEDLFHRALTTGEEGRGGRDDAKGELGKSRGGGAGAKAPKKTGRGMWSVKDARALGEKERVDRALRKLARTMKDGGGADTGKASVVRCGEGVGAREKTPVSDEKDSCGKWLESGWKWCPYCGREQS